MPIRLFRMIETGVVVDFGAPVDGWKTNVTPTLPGGTEAEAESVKTTGVNEGAERTAEAGITVTPAGRPKGVTVIVGGAEQALGTIDAVTVAASPPEVSSTVAGETTGVKSAAMTLTTKVVTADSPPASPTCTFTTFCPGKAPAIAEIWKEAVLAGGSAPIGIVAGETLRSVGRLGNVTVGDPT